MSLRPDSEAIRDVSSNVSSSDLQVNLGIVSRTDITSIKDACLCSRYNPRSLVSPDSYRVELTSSIFQKLQDDEIKSANKCGLTPQTFDFPRIIFLQCVADTVVQAVGTSLPKFHFHGFHDITSPMYGSRYFLAFKFLFEFFIALV